MHAFLLILVESNAITCAAIAYIFDISTDISIDVGYLDINRIVYIGDDLYKASINEIKRNRPNELIPAFLSVGDIDGKVQIGSKCYKIIDQYTDSNFDRKYIAHGMCTYDEINDELNKFFGSGNTFGVFMACGYSFTVFKMGSFYFMLDSNEHGLDGFPISGGSEERGTAVLVQMLNTDSLTNRLQICIGMSGDYYARINAKSSDKFSLIAIKVIVEKPSRKNLEPQTVVCIESSEELESSSENLNSQSIECMELSCPVLEPNVLPFSNNRRMIKIIIEPQ